MWNLKYIQKKDQRRDQSIRKSKSNKDSLLRSEISSFWRIVIVTTLFWQDFSWNHRVRALSIELFQHLSMKSRQIVDVNFEIHWKNSVQVSVGLKIKK